MSGPTPCSFLGGGPSKPISQLGCSSFLQVVLEDEDVC